MKSLSKGATINFEGRGPGEYLDLHVQALYATLHFGRMWNSAASRNPQSFC